MKSSGSDWGREKALLQPESRTTVFDTPIPFIRPPFPDKGEEVRWDLHSGTHMVGRVYRHPPVFNVQRDQREVLPMLILREDCSEGVLGKSGDQRQRGRQKAMLFCDQHGDLPNPV